MAGSLENRGKLRELIDKSQFAELTQKSSKELFFLPGIENLQVFWENLYLRKKYNINMNIMNIILEAVNIPKYFPLRFLFFFAIYLKLIRLAMDAIRVPRPPILVPTIKDR